MNRSEIEVLLKMRTEGQQALGVFGGAIKGAGDEGAAAAPKLRQTEQATRDTGIAATAASVTIGILAEKGLRALAGGVSSAVDQANRLDTSLQGLSVVARGMNVDVDAATAAAQDLAANGLMGIQEAATGLKNLLATGFSLPEATQLMKAAGDSAAFNRQGMLGYGEAVVRFTEGIKFGNSALTDSTGLGRNLSKIMTDAGRAQDDAGKAAQDHGVRLAILNGFTNDAAIFTGNAAKYADSYAGSQIRAGAAAALASAAIGHELQPAYAAAASIGATLLGVVQKHPGAFVSATATIAPYVAYLAGAKIAGSFLLPVLTGLTGGVTSLGVALRAASLGAAVTEIGFLGTVALAAGVAFGSWQLGKWIGEVTGLTEGVQHLTERILGFKAALSKETEGAKMDVIARAVHNGAAAWISYADAIVYNTRIEAIRQGTFDKSVGAQRASVEALRDLGKITADQAKQRLDEIAQEERLAQIRASHVSLSTALAAADKKVRDEIAATNLTVPELTKALKDNEAGFKTWSDAHHLSAETIKFLQDRLKDQTDADKKATAEKKKATEAIDQQRQALEQLGIVTKTSVVEGLTKLSDLEKRATAEGVPMQAVLIALLPKLIELDKNARMSGVGIDAAAAALRRGRDAMAAYLAATVPVVAVQSGLSTMPGKLIDISQASVMAAFNATQLRGAYDTFNLKTPKELLETARQSVYAFNLIKNSGTATPQQIKDAFEQMEKDVKATSGRIPTYWESDVRPRIKSTLDSMGRDVSDNISGMLLGMKGFKEGFIGIWQSIKSSVLNILGEIVDAYLRNFLGRILGVQKGGAGGILGSLFGGGGATSVAGLAPTGGGAAGAGGLTGALGLGGGISQAALGTLLNVGLSGGAGFGLGMLGKKLFGGPGVGAGIFGGLSGGLLGGLAFGGPIGALVGGGIGLLTGLLGKKESSKVNDERDKYLLQFGGGGTGQGSGFATLAKQLADIGRSDLFDKVLSAKKMNDFNAAVEKANTALEENQKKLDADAAAAARVAAANADAASKVVDLMGADELAALHKGYASAQAEGFKGAEADFLAQQLEFYQTLKEGDARLKTWFSGTTIDAFNLIKNGQGDLAKSLTDKIKGINDEMKGLVEYLATEAPEAEIGIAERIALSRLEQLKKDKVDVEKSLHDAADAAVQSAADAAKQAAKDAAAAIQDELDKREFSIKVKAYVDPVDGDQRPSERPGGAAAGIFANRPTLAIFGEGGEPELGGPVSFMAKALEGALQRRGSGGDAGGGPMNVSFTIHAPDGAGVRKAGQELVDLFRTDGTLRDRMRRVLNS